jgi:uncharacterized phage protein gp47/JayE
VPASPDATPYVDLRLFDKDSQDIFQAAIVALQAYLPEWEAREGHTEVVLLEALALEVSEAIFAINRLPGASLEALLRLYGIDRDEGQPPTSTLTITVSDTAGHTLPAGVRASLPTGAGGDPVVFTTTAQLVIPAGQTSGTVAAVGDRATAEVNGVIPGVALELLDAIVFVERVVNGDYVVGGTEPEDDAAWFSRGVVRFSRLVETLVLPRHFQAAALERADLVSRAVAIDNYDPGQAGAVGTHAGHVTVAVYGLGGVLTPVQREQLRIEFDLQAQANLAVHVIDPTITDVTINVTVVPKAGYSTVQVQNAVVAALTAYLAPASWPWAGKVYRNELIALIDGVEGVERVDTLTTPAADLTLAGVAPLARLAANPTVTVTGP